MCSVLLRCFSGCFLGLAVGEIWYPRWLPIRVAFLASPSVRSGVPVGSPFPPCLLERLLLRYVSCDLVWMGFSPVTSPSALRI